MRVHLHDQLKNAEKNCSLPSVIAYQRIDGPGSSLDLREFQQALWRLPIMPKSIASDPELKWSSELPRTIAITINTGTRITALPFSPNLIGVKSLDYNVEVISKPGEVLPKKENWLLKILELFNLSGVMFVLENLRQDIKSAGLGGSATAATGVCILANELSGKPFNEIQLIAMASRIEQDFGVSIVGTQEQSNVVFGGITDYVWFPWGIPDCPGTGYGESIRTELITPKDYPEIESRTAIFHTGKVRQSTDVNSVWRNALLTGRGFALHKQKPRIAYEFRESLRLKDWNKAIDAIRRYRDIRIALCSDYMKGSEEISKIAESMNCTAFPLGAGGGGAVLVMSSNNESLNLTKEKLKTKYQEIPFKIEAKGHKIINSLEGK
jgi:galactokinase/mevalonate kinase-like predicted kinase